MSTPTLIYCAKKNRFAPIALAAGWRYGSRLPNAVYERPYFVDQNWKHPRKKEYIDAVAKYRPALATVLDLEHPDQLTEVLSWAQLVAPYVSEAVIIIPKYVGAIESLPREIGGRPVRLGYSVPTTHGGTDVPPAHFMGWQVHLLGGNPLRQLALAAPHFDREGCYVSLDVCSVDCNYIQKSAVKWAQYIELSEIPSQNSMYGAVYPVRWRQLHEVGLGDLRDAPYEAFRRSVASLTRLWEGSAKSKTLPKRERVF